LSLIINPKPNKGRRAGSPATQKEENKMNRPKYYDGDYWCAKCGEPWDAYGVRHAEDMTENERDRFLMGEGCPVCWKRPDQSARTKVFCPQCHEEVWDIANVDQRLNKCWNCGLRFNYAE
jgi:ssDNA-binding Zn-finger/Zn-ribbon topoisomerase 1